MRIYDLAKSLEQRFSITIKSGDLADEFKTLREFEDIRDRVKSHASSVDDRHARLMFQIYEQRQAEGGRGPEVPGASKAAGPQTVAGREDVRVLGPQAAPSAPARAVAPVAKVPPPLPPKPVPGPRRAPMPSAGVRSPAPRPIAPIAGVRRPSRIEPAGKVALGSPGSEPVETRTPPRPIPPAASKAPLAPSPGQGNPESTATGAPESNRERTDILTTQAKGGIGTVEPPGTQKGAGGASSGRASAQIGQPAAPPPPRFSAGSAFTKPKEPPRPSASVRPPRPKVVPGKSEAITTEQLLKLEIGTMKAKPKRGRKGVSPDPKAAAGRDQAKPGRGRIVVRPSKVYGGADEFRRPIKPKKTKGSPAERKKVEDRPKVVGPVILTGPVTVGEFAVKINLLPTDLIKQAFLKGNPITINQLMDMELAEEIAIENDIDLIVQLEGDETDVAEFVHEEDHEQDLIPRPPVVTIMGHVDHGKTSVLDYYRSSQVAEGEFGGITQHIGAYEVKTQHGRIIFLDTPGHEAFTAMRARGVKCTDFVVLVVGADDGVMPQTIESINHAKAANVPFIVAINKIDLPQADPDRVRQGLMQHGVIATQLGGDVEFMEISAKTGKGMEDLLELIGLQSQVLELKTNTKRRAEAVVIESHVDTQRGAVATVLVQRGTLAIGAFFVVGQQSGRVRAMLDDHGRTVESASLCQPVALIGLSGTPEVGELLIQMPNERMAREIAERRQQRRRLVELGTTRHVSLEGLHDRIAEGEIKELNIILKADVQGSIEAIAQSLDKLAGEEIRVRILHSGTGSITESDVTLAIASDAIIIGFNIRPEPSAHDLALREGIEIKLYRIIYELLEDIESALVGMLDKRFSEQSQGRGEVRMVFRVSRVGSVAGCMVVSGEIQRNAMCRLVRDGTVVYEGKISSLRRVKEDVSKVGLGFECGIALERFQDVKEGDIIETYTLEEIPAELTRASI